MKLLKFLIALVLIFPSVILATPLFMWQSVMMEIREVNFSNWSQIPYFWCWFHIASTLNYTRYNNWRDEIKRSWR